MASSGYAAGSVVAGTSLAAGSSGVMNEAPVPTSVRAPFVSCMNTSPRGVTRTGAVVPSGSVISPFASTVHWSPGGVYRSSQPTQTPAGAGAGVLAGAAAGSVAGTAAGSTAASPAIWVASVVSAGLASMSVWVRAGAAASSTMASIATSNIGLFI